MPHSRLKPVATAADNADVDAHSARRIAMGLPEPLEPQPDAAPPQGPEPGGGRADWLVGAEEGIEAELQRKQHDAGARPAPKLFRPGASEGIEPAPAPPPPVTPTLSRPAGSFAPSAPEEPAAAPAGEKPRVVGTVSAESTTSDFTSGLAMSWEPGANSVPALRHEAPRMAAPEPTRDFPMDDAEERARVNAESARLAAMAAESAVRPHDVVAPEVFDLPAVPLPWWMQVPAAFRADRRLQVLAGLGVVLLLTIAFFPRGERGVSLTDLKKHGAHFDGQDVKVSGRIGEVFQVGGGYAFYLHQGRDTIVVFTRSRTPRSRDNVQLVGHVSMGYLDGQQRLALFENSPSGN